MDDQLAKLERRFETEPGNLVVARALAQHYERISWKHEGRTIGEWIGELKCGDRGRVVESLSRLRELGLLAVEARFAVRDAILDPNIRTESFYDAIAGECLAGLGEAASDLREELLDWLKDFEDEDPLKSKKALNAAVALRGLAKEAPEIIEAMILALGLSSNDEFSCALIVSLGALGQEAKAARSVITEVYHKSRDFPVVEHAMEALGKLGADKGTLLSLFSATYSEECRDRERAAWNGCGSMLRAHPETIEWLIEDLESTVAVSKFASDWDYVSDRLEALYRAFETAPPKKEQVLVLFADVLESKKMHHSGRFALREVREQYQKLGIVEDYLAVLEDEAQSEALRSAAGIAVACLEPDNKELFERNFRALEGLRKDHCYWARALALYGELIYPFIFEGSRGTAAERMEAFEVMIRMDFLEHELLELYWLYSKWKPEAPVNTDSEDMEPAERIADHVSRFERFCERSKAWLKRFLDGLELPMRAWMLAFIVDELFYDSLGGHEMLMEDYDFDLKAIGSKSQGFPFAHCFKALDM